MSEFLGVLAGSMFFYQRIIGMNPGDIPNGARMMELIGQYASPIGGNDLVETIRDLGSVDSDQLRDLLGGLDHGAFLAGFVAALTRLMALSTIQEKG